MDTKNLLAALLWVISVGAHASDLVSVQGLLWDQAVPWWFQAQPTNQAVQIEQGGNLPDALKARARTLVVNRTARAVVFVDASTIIYKELGAPATDQSTFAGFSMTKTITSMAVGKAVCDGKLSMATKVKDVLTEFAGTGLGEATVRDLLMMASGATESSSGTGSLMTADERARWQRGDLNLHDFIMQPRSSSAQRGLFSTYKPGERFSYKSTDPDTLGLMIERATQMPYGYWVRDKVFGEMGIAHTALIDQDKEGHAHASGGIRMKLDDWVRFAIWVKRAWKEQSCFGEYVREASSTQIQNPGTPQTRPAGKVFGGYGHLIWTENMFSPRSFWARGLGGQCIGWSTQSDRMFLLFATSEDWLPEAYALANDWFN